MNERIKDVTDNSFAHEVLKSEKPVLVDFGLFGVLLAGCCHRRLTRSPNNIRERSQ